MNEAAPSRALIRAVLRRRIPVLVGCGVLACLHQGGEALVAVLIGVVVDRAIDGGSVSTLLFWLAVLAVDFAVLSGSFRWGSRLAQREAELVAHDLREDLVGRVLHPAGDLATGSRAGELSTLAVQDTKRVGTLMMTVPLAVAAVAAVVVSAVALLVSSVPLGLLVLLGTPLLLVLSRLASRPLEARSGDEQRDVALATGVATDLVRGLRVLKGFGAEATATERYTRASRRSLAATVRAARAGAALNGAVPAMTGVFIAVVAGVGGVLAVRGDLSVGGLVAAVGLAQFLLGPLTLFSMVTAGIAQARASAARIADALPEAPTAHHDAAPLAPTTGGRRVEIVGARIGDRPPLCLTVDAGDLVGLVVPDRAASADLLAVLAGEAQRETLRLDGIAADRVPPADLRAEILVERHDAALFRGSVEDNVRPARSTAPVPAGVWSATAADEVVACLPDAADTDIGERGLSLSGGQRQRVALARALAVDSPVLVLDEPTTAVDSVTEARIAAGIRDLRQGRTTVVLTTSPLLLAATDVVHLVLPDGTVASGRHQDLARDHPGYRAAVMTR